MGKRKMDLTVWVLILLLLVQISTMIYWGEQKKGYHMDEIYTYSLANADGVRRINQEEDFYNNWRSGDAWNDHIIVNKDNRFDYIRAYEDSKLITAHPPLYFLLVHTVMSFFPETFSKWYAMAINILFFAGSVIVLYHMGIAIFRNKWIALLPCVIWGFSGGAVNSNVYLRMYTMMTFSCLGIAYEVGKLVIKGMSIKRLINIFIYTFLGTMTQYYFLIFAFFLCGGYCIYVLLQRKWRVFWSFVGTMFLAILACCLFYPPIVTDLLYGSRGSEAIESALNGSNFIKNLIEYFKITSAKSFGGFLKEFVIAFSVICIVSLSVYIFIISRKTKQEYSYTLKTEIEKNANFSALLTLWIIYGFTILAYIIVVAKIAPYQAVRYVFCIFPLITFILIWAVKWLCCSLGMRTLYFGLTTLVVFGYFSYASMQGGVSHLYSPSEKYIKTCEEYSEYPAVVIEKSTEKFQVYSSYCQIQQFSNIYVSNSKNITQLREDSLEVDCSEGVVVFVVDSLDQEKTLAAVQKVLGHSTYKKLFAYSNHTVYLMNSAMDG